MLCVGSSAATSLIYRTLDRQEDSVSSKSDAKIFARPFEFDLERWSDLLSKVAEHRPWYDDDIWGDEERRRDTASAHVAAALDQGKVWEVFHGAELVGILLVERLNYGRSGTCHFVFFDRQLANKRQLCLNTMAHLFETYQLEILRVEIPTYAKALANWVRKKLGFRWEAESRTLSGTTKRLSADEAALGSRKFHMVKYKDEWHDLLLLSITREEFQETHGHLRHPPTETRRSPD